MTDTKGKRTRERIVTSAAPIFNQRGYGASVSDLMEATGLEKGGIYRHFESKDAIAVAAFDHTVRLQAERIRAYVSAAPRDAVARMVAVAEALASVTENPTVPGGCPLLNTAVECDDADDPLHRELRSRTRRAMTDLLRAVAKIVGEGVSSGELAAATRPDAEASTLVASMEGAIMMSKLYKDPAHVWRAVARVRERAESLRRRRASAKTGS